MTKNISIAVTALVLLSVLNCTAIAEDTSGGRWYVGGGLGAASGLDLCNAFTPGFSTTAGSCDRSEFAGKAFGGYKFNKYVGAEGALVWLGSAEANGTYLGVPTTSDAWAGGLELVGVGTLPITDKFGILGKLGGFVWSVYNETGTGFDDYESGLSFAMGAGLKYDINAHVGIRFEWERFWDVGNSTVSSGDVDMFTIGGLYRF